MKLEFGNATGYDYIDEIQRKEDAGVFMKGLYDMSLPYKFIISGSGSVELKEKVHESLAGRKAMFEVYPVSFREFVNFKTEYKYSDRLVDYLRLKTQKHSITLRPITNSANYRGLLLKAVWKKKDDNRWKSTSSYIEKDIAFG